MCYLSSKISQIVFCICATAFSNINTSMKCCSHQTWLMKMNYQEWKCIWLALHTSDSAISLLRLHYFLSMLLWFNFCQTYGWRFKKEVLPLWVTENRHDTMQIPLRIVHYKVSHIFWLFQACYQCGGWLRRASWMDYLHPCQIYGAMEYFYMKLWLLAVSHIRDCLTNRCWNMSRKATQ